jgi:hypothetical protein
MTEFVGFPKIPRYSRECVITEKIDGTNAQIFIAENSEPITLSSGRIVPFLCGSRNRWVFPENDNHRFAAWAFENVEELLKLGPGRHFGEWWGNGIQRGYGLKEKRFSLFNVTRWEDPCVRPSCCGIVPILYRGPFRTEAIEYTLDRLDQCGSSAAPGFMNPEGIVIYHVAGNVLFKKTIENDEAGKRQEEK